MLFNVVEHTLFCKISLFTDPHSSPPKYRSAKLDPCLHFKLVIVPSDAVRLKFATLHTSPLENLYML